MQENLQGIKIQYRLNLLDPSEPNLSVVYSTSKGEQFVLLVPPNIIKL